MAAPIILLPPSEGKAPGGRRPARTPDSGRFSELGPVRTGLIEALRAAMERPEPEVAKLLGVKGNALAAAIAANRSVGDSRTMPAIERYTGVLYGALDHPGLDRSTRRRCHQQVIIFSGLWGLVSPVDQIPDYKLKMGASLGGVGRVSTHWRSHITAALHPVTQRRTVWDLLPIEHASAWQPDPTSYRQRITARFADDVPDGSGRKLISVAHWNKLLKGALVRHVLETQLTDPAGLAEFSHPEGYVYRPDLTVTNGRSVEVTFVAVRG